MAKAIASFLVFPLVPFFVLGALALVFLAMTYAAAVKLILGAW